MTRSQLQAAGRDHDLVRCGRFDQRTRKHSLQVVRYAAIGCHPLQEVVNSRPGRDREMADSRRCEFERQTEAAHPSYRQYLISSEIVLNYPASSHGWPFRSHVTMTADLGTIADASVRLAERSLCRSRRNTRFLGLREDKGHDECGH